jgi:ribosomal protein S18 acetylase RimI-like enzyme
MPWLISFSLGDTEARTLNIDISRFRSEDADAAATVLLQFTGRPPLLDRLTTFLAADSHYFLAASIADEWVGFAYAYELPRPDGTSMLFLYSIDVHPDYQRRGVATALLSYLRRAADEHDMKEVFVIASRSNDAAVSFYGATGEIVEGGDSVCFVYPSHNAPDGKHGLRSR